MKSTRLLPWVCAFISVLCLIFGFNLVGYWEIVFIIPALLLFWYCPKKVPPRVTISIILIVYVLLAAIGILINLSPYLMIIGVSFALAGWESVLFIIIIDNECAKVDHNTLHLEILHLRDLITALGVGLLIAFLGHFLRLHLSFGLVAILALLAIYGFYRGVGILSR